MELNNKINVFTCYLNLPRLSTETGKKAIALFFKLYFITLIKHIRKHINSASQDKSVYNKTEQGNCVYRKGFQQKSMQYNQLKRSVHTLQVYRKSGK